MKNDLTLKYVGKVEGVNPNLSFLEHEIPNYNILVFPGGTRSGKTYSIIQWIWFNMQRYRGIEYTIARKTLAALKITALKDFVAIGLSMGLYNTRNHNLTDNIYRHNGNTVLFLGADDDEKLRGAKQHILYINEAPELEWPVVKQLLFRTENRVLLDYNPSYPDSWVYENIHSRDTSAFITTTFLDNPHVSQTQLDELAWMKENDPEGYVVYGLGLRGELKGQVFKNWKPCKELPSGMARVFTIDFGYTNDPAVIAEFSGHNRAIYGKEHLYAKGMDNIDLAICLHFAGATNDSLIVADSAEPKSVGEIRQGWALEPDYIRQKVAALGYPMDDIQLISLKKALSNGFPVLLARKGPDSIDAGIQLVKQNEVFITEDSINAWREYRKYRWAEDKKTGNLLNIPVDTDNHFMDCLRYYALAAGYLF